MIFFVSFLFFPFSFLLFSSLLLFSSSFPFLIPLPPTSQKKNYKKNNNNNNKYRKLDRRFDISSIKLTKSGTRGRGLTLFSNSSELNNFLKKGLFVFFFLFIILY